jgi:hypothetical protein
VSRATWQRVCPGLYVDPTRRWVVERQERGLYSVRVFLGWGSTLNGLRLFPDYGGTWYGSHHTLAEAKAAVETMTAAGWFPEHDTDWTNRKITEGAL